MNSLKNLRHALSPILRRRPAVRPKPPPPPPPKPSTRCYHTSPRRPEPSRGLLRRITNPAVSRPPAPALPRHYSSLSWGSFFSNPLRGGEKWYQNPHIVYAAVATTCGVALTLCFGTFETVPYSNRTLSLPNRRWERTRGESEFSKMKKKLEKKILPPDHPDSVCVNRLVTEIVGAAQRGLVRREILYAGDASYGGIPSSHDTNADAAARPDPAWYEDISACYDQETDDAARRDKEVRNNKSVSVNASYGSISSGDHDTEAAAAARRGKEVLDERSVSVPRSRNRWKANGAPLQAKHLDGLNWEVIVVQEKGVNAMCLPGGKIIVYTGLLDHFKTDAEVATVLGHEVGHVVARHAAEHITTNIWIMIIECFIQIFSDADAKDLDRVSSLLFRLPFSRRMELEADHIGILLLSAAGFDPHIAPSVYEKLGKIGGDLGVFDFISTHPSSTKRARLLSEHMVMEEAMELYIEAKSGKESRGFF
ncbi:uncharacterized protein LOC124690634 [Lolium rigidum]|uniref:uncharacterized protein LOC124690634 n=1 Tax=Lolium rigidum TaxID=89674 RepID=UPI001F5DC2FC|nr:uncharacterized protein LOC124690634 [Lolium rigidum]